MKRGMLSFLVVVSVSMAWLAPAGAETRRAVLTGLQEVPVVVTPGVGTFRADISADETEIAFELTYRDLTGTVTGAHIHAGQPDVAGNIVVHLCGTGGKPACPAPPALVSGVITAADVVAVASQGIGAGDIDKVIGLMRRRASYVNVHSSPNHGAGEIRGNVR